ncbi:MAG: hypothetical protein JO107_01265 [Hyphomicrobiales bacterium]|nr:hypothetical protein [Hyphomicrobiales bacterium]MBV8661707.1 hypothetical protein [Hyphomicrobiales bacterium]
MNEAKPDHLKSAPTALRSAIRRARVESAEQSEAVAELREAEIARLELLLEAVRPVLDQAPEGIELFDPGISHGERPRLFLDMISFVELGHDRRTYRFFQDTRHGRVLIAESPLIERTVVAMTNYIARRLVEREQALASDWRSRETPTSSLKDLTPGARTAAKPGGAPQAKAAVPTKHGWLAVAGDVFGFLLVTLGTATFIGLVAIGAFAAWDKWGRAVWAARFGPPPI